MNSPPEDAGRSPGDLARAARLDDGLAPLTLVRPALTSSSRNICTPFAASVILVGFWVAGGSRRALTEPWPRHLAEPEPALAGMYEQLPS